MTYPLPYLNYAKSLIPASRAIEDYAIMDFAGPSDPGMLKITDDDVGETYYADACPRIEPHALYHYVTPSDLTIEEGGNKWNWADFKPINEAFEKFAKQSLFSDVISQLAVNLAAKGLQDNEQEFASYLQRNSFYLIDGYWQDNGNSIPFDLWKAFQNYILNIDLRVLFAGDIIYRIGDRDSFFNEAEPCVHLNKTIYGIDVKPKIKLLQNQLIVSFSIEMVLINKLPFANKMLSQVETWKEMF